MRPARSRLPQPVLFTMTAEDLATKQRDQDRVLYHLLDAVALQVRSAHLERSRRTAKLHEIFSAIERKVHQE
jgi:hypothetical protein